MKWDKVGKGFLKRRTVSVSSTVCAHVSVGPRSSVSLQICSSSRISSLFSANDDTFIFSWASHFFPFLPISLLSRVKQRSQRRTLLNPCDAASLSSWSAEMLRNPLDEVALSGRGDVTPSIQDPEAAAISIIRQYSWDSLRLKFH